jgi:hypothetical protein
MIEELAREAGLMIVFLAGISYVAVGIYLLQTAAREDGGPSFILGLALLFNGFSFGFAELPFVIASDLYVELLTFIGRIAAAACCISIAMFTWRVFRGESRWGGFTVGLIAAVIVAGLTISVLEGDWEAYSPLSYKGFWFEWAGSLAPFVWLSFESLSKYAFSRRRIPLGLIDPVVCNRYFLIGFYAALASLTYCIYIPMYIVYELHGVWSGWIDIAVGLVELISVTALGLSFTAPPFYRRWIGASAAAASKN